MHVKTADMKRKEIMKNNDRIVNTNYSHVPKLDTCGGVLLFLWMSGVGCETNDMNMREHLLKIMFPGHHQ